MSEELFEPHSVDTYRHQVQPAIKSKVDELHYLGYTRATADNVWSCLKKKRWHKNEQLRLHQVVSDVLSLSPHDYMNYLTQESYRNDQDWFADFEQKQKSDVAPEEEPPANEENPS
ncbi:post-transcriptional regulator [Bacillus tianshenii]|nr:post-transcriptional regulator [Bacillus tianshenii]